MVSVIVCLYNGERFLAEALESAFAQTHSEFELIGVDDGSTDGTAAILSRYGDSRLRVIRQSNQGAAAALDAGIRAARGEYVALLDQDDRWTPDHLAAHIDLLERRPEIDLAFSWFRVIDEYGHDTGLRSNRYRGTIDFRRLAADFVIGGSSNVVTRRGAIEQCGGVDRSLPLCYDLDLFLRIALLRPVNVEAVPRDLTLYRRHGSQLTRDIYGVGREFERVLDKLRSLAPSVIREVEPLARSNMRRYLARLAYENHRYGEGLKLLASGFRSSPLRFLIDRRNWLTGAACLSGLLLPSGLHRTLERTVGLKRSG